MSNSISNYSNYTLIAMPPPVSRYVYVLAFYRENTHMFYIKDIFVTISFHSCSDQSKMLCIILIIAIVDCFFRT